MSVSKVFCGADRVLEYAGLFEGKKIGLITNPTGVLRNLTATADFMYRNFDLTAMYSPEHGVRGDAQAGDKVESYIDAQTGITVYSIYGEHRFPSPEILRGIDVMVYDIQDIGSRYYTYIYSMANCMKACAKLGIEFVVLDRPNPIGADSPEGTGMEDGCRSFIGQYPILQRYALTCGELARLFNHEYGLGAKLTVVPVQGWKRNQLLSDTDLQMINPSPNIASMDAMILYNGTGLFEGTNLSEGRGTTRPFEYIGAPWMDAYRFAGELNALELPGVLFRPAYFTPIFHKHKDSLCAGVQVHVLDRRKVKPLELGVNMVLKARELSGAHFEFVPPRHEIGDYTIDLLMGSDIMRREGTRVEDVLAEMDLAKEKFLPVWAKYKIYD